MTKIHEEIKRFKQINGNAEYSQKEMIMYIMSKIDKIDEKLEIGSGKIAENRARLDGLMKGLTIIFPVFCAIIGWIILRII